MPRTGISAETRRKARALRRNLTAPERDEFLRTQGFRVLRFCNGDVMQNPDGVVQAILDEVQRHG